MTRHQPPLKPNSDNGDLRRGWTTGACACAASVAAFAALVTGRFADPVRISLPKGQSPVFPLAESRLERDVAIAAVVKDAGDDPDVTHGALVRAEVRWARRGGGIVFRAGPGVGTVTLPGLPLPPGEPAINPAPRRIIRDNLNAWASDHGVQADVEITLSIPGGELLAQKTWNLRLGVRGGLSILGTTGVVVPFSCSAWIHSIHRGVDVARAVGHRHVAAATGRTSEQAAQKLYDLPEDALLDMGDFAGGLLKYLRRRPVPRLTLAGGFAKILKLSQGNLDLHSLRSRVDFSALAALVEEIGGSPQQAAQAKSATTALQVLRLCEDLPLAAAVADRARRVVMAQLDGIGIVDVLIVGRDGDILANRR